MSGSPIDVNQFSIDHLLLAQDAAGDLIPGGSGSLVREQPDLSRYLIGEVAAGRMGICEGYSPAAVDAPTMEAFEDLALRCGGESFEVRPRQQPYPLITIVRLGKTLVAHVSEAGPASPEPAGVPLVVGYESQEEAKAKFERKKRSFVRDIPGAVVLRTEIDVEWDKLARLPVRHAD